MILCYFVLLAKLILFSGAIMRTTACSLLLMLMTCGAAFAGQKSITFFSDGAVVEISTAAANGIAEISLPTGMAEKSLRIRPVGNTVIRQVDIVPARIDTKRVKEIESLTEQKSRQEDRLKALQTREEIFRAAAKSQSGKAPRKSKSNPDPMQSIKQGTEYAIAQLESVYTARRKTEQEIRRIEARLTVLKNSGTTAEAVARISVTPKSGSVSASYLLSGFAWTPVYDLRINNDGNARVALSGQLPQSFSGYRLKAAAASVDEMAVATVKTAGKETSVGLADYLLPSSEEIFGNGPTAPFSFTLTNSTQIYLPPGIASVYHKGVFTGKVRFEGISSGRSKKVTSAQ
jgi:prophage maintenance system killer protein